MKALHRQLSTLFLIAFSTMLNAQLQTDGLEIISLNDSSIAEEFLIAYTIRDFKGNFGLQKEDNSIVGIKWADGWPLIRYEVNPLNSGKDNSHAQSFRRLHDGRYLMYLLEGSTDTAVTTPFERYIVLDSKFARTDTIPVNADNHGMDIDYNGRFIYNENLTTRMDFPQFGWVDTPTTTGDLRAFDEISRMDTSLQFFPDAWDSTIVLDAYKTEGNVSKEFDWHHFNEARITRDNHYLVNHRHLGCEFILGDSTLFWIGMNDTLAANNNVPVLTQVGGGNHELVLQHNGREVPTGVFNSAEQTDTFYISFFDNGNEARGYSRAVVYGIDLANNTQWIEFERQFDYSPFAGSVEFRPEMGGLMQVNVPWLPVSRFQLIQWVQTNQLDSVEANMASGGSYIYLMKLNGDTLAEYRTQNGNFVYQAELMHVSEGFGGWDRISCVYYLGLDSASISMQSGDSVRWIDTAGNSIAFTSDLIAGVGQVSHAEFELGMMQAWSRQLNDNNCQIPFSLNGSWGEKPGIFPNPGNGLYQIEITNELRGRMLVVTDQLGRVLKEIKLRKEELDLRDLPDGTYYFHIPETRQSGQLIKLEE